MTRLIRGRAHGNVRALGTIEMKAGARFEGDVSAYSVIMETRCPLRRALHCLEVGGEAVGISTEPRQG